MGLQEVGRWFMYVQAGAYHVHMKGKVIDHNVVKDVSPKKGFDSEVS
jgi:hypothetical protein